MQRVARVLLEVDDADLKKWAEEDEQTVAEVVSDAKNEFEEFIRKNRGGAAIGDIEFIEWEDFCPYCESTDLEWRLTDSLKSSHRRDYRCQDCEHEFTEEEVRG